MLRKSQFVLLAVLAIALMLPTAAFAAPVQAPPTSGNHEPWATLTIAEDGLSILFEGYGVRAIDSYREYCDGTSELIVFEKPLRPPQTWVVEKPLAYTDSLIYIKGQEGLFLLQAEPRPCPGGVDRPDDCPTCGRPVWESASGAQGDGLALVWYGVTPCVVCQVGGDFFVEFERRARAWSTIPFSFEYPAGVLHEAETVTGSDGVTYYVLDVEGNVADNAIIWGPDGVGDRFRDHGPVYKYSACSVAPGYYDAPGGTATWKPGHNTSDWVKFLLDNGFFPDEQYRGDAAIAWANQLREEGTLALP